MTSVMQAGPASARARRKAESRRRILDAAARLFRLHGIDAVGVDAIMHAAGLTHGGFYGHFPSKEALAAEVCADELRRSADRWARYAEEIGGSDALARIVGNYLRPEHAMRGDGGCVLPVLGSEIARRHGACSALTETVRDMAETLDRLLPPTEAGRRAGLAALSCMVGAVMLARLADDPALRDQLLDAARTAILGRLGAKR
ncbi:MAG TPA: helix-turn-helix domain-containing protein [Acidisphaera sp.]|nr:helix-turn-helix domain-containing protein [Acidisphaera sp.]